MDKDGHRIRETRRARADWRIWLALGVPAAVGLGVSVGWNLRGQTADEGTIALCVPEDAAATGVLAIDAFDRAPVRHRSLVPLDARTGTSRPHVDAGTRAECLGGVGPNVLLATETDGIHVRDPATGALVTTEAQLLGDAAGHVAKWEYDAPAHRLTVHTTVDEALVLDPFTRAHLAAPEDAGVEASAVTHPSAHALAALAEFSQHTAFYGPPGGPVLDTVGSYGLACAGSTCRLGTRQVDTYGNGGELEPLPGAEPLLGARGQLAVPGCGVLVTRRTGQGEGTRQLALVGPDGHVRWSLPELPDGSYAGVLPDAAHLLLTRTLVDNPRDRREASAYLVDLATGRLAWTVRFPARASTVWDTQLGAASARYGDTVLIGAQGVVVAMPLGPGAERWRFEP